MTNRLSSATSPYLLEHAGNPIDWWEWSDSAFEEARRRDVPILLSVGYAACHWCHVMARESFSDPITADQVNADFVAIKVDREERPDVDAVYMAATQSMTGRGGWPMTCFLTPFGEPFHCGTYYPSTPRAGLPSFRQMLAAVTKAWSEDGERVQNAAREITARLRQTADMERTPTSVGPTLLARSAESLFSEFDEVNGGFGGAPKFPPALCLEFLLRHHERTRSARAIEIVVLTCERMARGGLYDQLAGGFSRYAVDESWAVPHFEKMLYDNALLLRVYAHLARLTSATIPVRVAADTARFILGDMRLEGGGFTSALDADSNGVEGLSYLWTPAQLIDALGVRDGIWAATLLEVTSSGSVDRGVSTLQLPADPDDADRWQKVSARLLRERGRRPQPARDDKVVTAWNGMAAHALTEAGLILDRPDWIEAAGEVVDFLISVHMIDGRLRRSSRNRRASAASAVLEDHAWLAEASLALHQATGDPARLEHALGILDLAIEHFADPARPGIFYDTADDAEDLLHRPRDIVDNATPSGSSATANALLTASVLADADRAGRYRELAGAAVAAVGEVLGPHARFAGHWLACAEAMAAGPIQVAIVGSEDDPGFCAMQRSARRQVPGGSVVVAGRPMAPDVPLLADRPLVADSSASYVCRGEACYLPAGSLHELDERLAFAREFQ